MAIEVIETPSDDGKIPIRVTAYQISATPKIIDKKTTLYKITSVNVIELYNSGDAPFDMSQLTITDGLTKSKLDFTPLMSGKFLLPKQHVTLSALVDGQPQIAGVSYGITNVDLSASEFGEATSLTLTAPGFRSRPVTIKTLDNGGLFKQNLGVDGYLDSFVLAVDADNTTIPPVDPLLRNQVADDGLYTPPAAPGGLEIVEFYPFAADCSPFDDGESCRDFVKIFNAGGAPIALDDLVLRTGSGDSLTDSNSVELSGSLAPGEYRAVSSPDFSLSNSGGYVWIDDVFGLENFHAALSEFPAAGSTHRQMAYAQFGPNDWRWTTTANPNGPNILTEPAVETTVCSEGKYLNPETGRCRNVADAVSSLAQCDEGSERNPLTGRCRKVATSAASAGLTPCREGYERNPTTNRCRSIASAVAELIPCNDGYERNRDTNRCRKIKTSDLPKADYPVAPYAQNSNQNLINWLIGGGIAALVLGYAVWEWRSEIAHGWRRLMTRGRK